MSKVKVNDYGDILALKCDGEKIYFSTSGGSYQGEYVAVIKATKKFDNWREIELDQYYVFTDSYGSCSGCDWLESHTETDYDSKDLDQYIDAKSALEYASQSTPLYILAEKPSIDWVNNLAYKVNGEN